MPRGRLRRWHNARPGAGPALDRKTRRGGRPIERRRLGRQGLDHATPFDGTTHISLDRDEALRLRSLGLPVVDTTLGSRCLGAAPYEGPCRTLVLEVGLAPRRPRGK
jgi:hypothetical protein